MSTEHMSPFRVKVQSLDDLFKAVEEHFPGAQVETDNNGQLIVYTGMYVDESTNRVQQEGNGKHKERPPERIEPIVRKLLDVWQAHPDWRLGQLLINVAREHNYSEGMIWHLEDEEWLKMLEEANKRRATQERI